MTRRDMPSVLAMEHLSFGHPWCEEELDRVYAQGNCIGMVVEPLRVGLFDDDRIVGFAVYEMRTKSIQIVRLAVHPELRRRGVGRELLGKLTGKLGSRRPGLAILVRESNLPAQYFFRSFGFRATLVVRGHYQDTGEDAYEMFYGIQEGGKR